MLSALKALNEVAGLDTPPGRQTFSNRTAVQAYALDMFDCVSKLVSEAKLPEIVVSSNELSRVPLNKKRMDNTEVATVNCKLEALEAMIKNVANNVNTVTTAVNKLSEKPSFSNTGTIPKVIVDGADQHAQGGGAVGGVFAVRSGVGAGGGQSGWPHLGGHGQGQDRNRLIRDRSPSLKRPYNDAANENLDRADGGDFQYPNRRR